VLSLIYPVLIIYHIKAHIKIKEIEDWTEENSSKHTDLETKKITVPTSTLVIRGNAKVNPRRCSASTEGHDCTQFQLFGIEKAPGRNPLQELCLPYSHQALDR
jgi:hypothetical protein